MKLPTAAHISQPWRIHEIAHDFRLEDVWALNTPGGAHDFPALVEEITSNTLRPSSRAARLLFVVRWKIGQVLGWEEQATEVGTDAPSLSDRLPYDLRHCPTGPPIDHLPFRSLYLLDNEWAAEIANRTMHGILHLGWVRAASGDYGAQLAILVKRHGLLGSAYMAAIKPFRRLVIYPAMVRDLERRWTARTNEADQGSKASRNQRLGPIHPVEDSADASPPN